MSKQKSQILKTVTFPDGSIWEVKEKLPVGLIVHEPIEYLYRHVVVDDSGCVIEAESGSIQAKLHHLVMEMWDTEERMTKVLDEVSTIVDGDANWPYMDFIVLAVQQEMEDKKKLEAQLETYKAILAVAYDAICATLGWIDAYNGDPIDYDENCHLKLSNAVREIQAVTINRDGKTG